MTMTHEQVGKYVRMLCFQHQSGHLTEEDMLDIAGDKDAKIWRKFKQDENGLYYNERLEQETIKRRKYTESRKKNLQSKKPHMESHMENVNENEDVIEINKKGMPAYFEFKEYALEKRPLVDAGALKNKYDAWVENGWRDGHDNPIKNWKSKLLNTLTYLPETVTKGRREKYEAPQDYGVPSPTAVPMPESIKKRISNIGKA
jgi:hypothetical protein